MREGGFVDFSHGLFKPRHMGIVENGKSVRIQRSCQLQSLFECFKRLKRQTVNQIDIDRCYTVFACKIDCCFGDFIGLDTVYRFLYFGIKILHAEADTVEAALFQCLHMCFGEKTRVYFTAYFRIFGKIGKRFFDQTDHFRQLFR